LSHFDAAPDPACHFDADPVPDPFHFDADPDPSLRIKAQNLEKMLKQDHIPHILACHLQLMRIRIQLINFDADPDPAYHLDADPHPVPTFNLMRIYADLCGSGSTTLE
jgi:hypothetical protein